MGFRGSDHAFHGREASIRVLAGILTRHCRANTHWRPTTRLGRRLYQENSPPGRGSYRPTRATTGEWTTLARGRAAADRLHRTDRGERATAATDTRPRLWKAGRPARRRSPRRGWIGRRTFPARQVASRDQCAESRGPARARRATAAGRLRTADRGGCAARIVGLDARRGCGHHRMSHGGVTGLVFALEHPRRVRTLTLIEPPATGCCPITGVTTPGHAPSRTF